jgi:hypothetical protein
MHPSHGTHPGFSVPLRGEFLHPLCTYVRIHSTRPYSYKLYIVSPPFRCGSSIIFTASPHDKPTLARNALVRKPLTRGGAASPLRPRSHACDPMARHTLVAGLAVLALAGGLVVPEPAAAATTMMPARPGSGAWATAWA